MADLQLPLFDREERAPRSSHLSRVVADSRDRASWLKARSRGITATDVAKLSTSRSVEAAAHEKWFGSRFNGNAFTEHGRAREPEIASWVLENHGIAPSSLLFHAEYDKRHLATPDGLAVTDANSVVLAEIKTTNKLWRQIPRHYLRQIWWQQYVLGAERTLFVWERHINFIPVGEPEIRWVERNDSEIASLVSLANELIATIDNLTNRHIAAIEV